MLVLLQLAPPGDGDDAYDDQRRAVVSVQGIARGHKANEVLIKRMTPAQIAEAQKLSFEYVEKYVVPFQKD